MSCSCFTWNCGSKGQQAAVKLVQLAADGAVGTLCWLHNHLPHAPTLPSNHQLTPHTTAHAACATPLTCSTRSFLVLSNAFFISA